MPDLEGVSLLDLYAGTGALGIEALSRGAAEVVFVDRSGPSTAVLRRNLARLGLESRARVLRADVRGALRRLACERRRFELVLADPPYADPGAAQVLALLGRGTLLAPGGSLVVERSRRHPLPPIAGFASVESRRYGEAVVTWLIREASEPGPGPEEGDPEA